MQLTQKKIIIVDDNEANLSVGRNLLKPYYEVYPAPSAAKLFNILEKLVPDLILLDVNMPEMNGYETIRRLKADKRFEQIPVVFLTAKNDEESEMEGFDLGAADYVTKPFSGPLLLRRISNQLLIEQQKRDLLASQAALQDYADNLEIKVREKTAAKTIFLANMSHELRTPMNSIVGFSELALDDDVSLKTRNYLSKILENSEWLLHIINDILEITNIESGKIDLNRVAFDLNEIVNVCRKMFMPKATENGLMLNFCIYSSIDKGLMGDPVRLRQALVNLLSNAIKFTNTGFVEFLMEIKDISNNTATVYFEISDSGVGMTPEQIGIIFDPFTQVEAGTTRSHGGTGLGLTITKNIIEMMGGSITVESTPGVGSKFSFKLTFDLIGEDEGKPKKRTMADITRKPRYAGEILICEDNEMNQHVAKETLAKVGFSTVIAGNGKIGYELVKDRMQSGEKLFDLIFMDIHMPVMDGIEATVKINELNSGIPIVAMTANIMPDDVKLYLASGMKSCIGKPFTFQELVLCLNEYFEPVSWQDENEDESNNMESDLRQKLINRFVNKNSGALNEIKDAIRDGDIKLAYRIAHNLKSSAGQLQKTCLQIAAQEVETSLKDGVNKTEPWQIGALEQELQTVIDELTPLVSEASANEISEYSYDSTAVFELFDKLEVLLGDSDPECLSLVDDLRFIKGSDELIRQIEDYDFKPAMETLEKIMEEMGLR